MATDGIDIGDIPEPPAPVDSRAIKDAFTYNVAFRFAFAGVGQCGGRVAETFAKLGYGRVCAINTTIQDLAELRLPAENKLDLGDARGAGKDPATAAALVADKGEEIFDLYKRSWGDEIDYAFICLAAAGGTGAGAFVKAIEVARQYMEQHKRPVKVGAIVALPKDAEGQKYAKNALYTMSKLTKLGCSPVIFLDNEKIKALFDPTTSKEHSVANTSTAQLLHLFNRLAGSDSEHTVFDRADFAKLLDAGVAAFGSQSLKSPLWENPANISTAVRDQLKRNILATTDLTTGRSAGLIYVLNGKSYDIKSSVLDHSAEMLTRILAKESTIFKGTYRGTASDDTLKMLVMIAGLAWPEARVNELARVAGVGPDEIAVALGV